MLPRRAPARDTFVGDRIERWRLQPYWGRRSPTRHHRSVTEEPVGRDWLQARRHHLSGHVAQSWGSFGERQRLRERDMDRAEGRARVHVWRYETADAQQR